MFKTLQILRSGSAALAVAVAFGGLVALAPLVDPTARPTRPDDAILLVGWWVAGAVLLWWIASVGYWTIALRSRALTSRSSVDPRSVRSPSDSVQSRLAIPGSRRVAESFLALALLAIPACAPGSADAPTMVLIGAASSTPETTLPIAPTPTTEPTTSITTEATLSTTEATTGEPTSTTAGNDAAHHAEPAAGSSAASLENDEAADTQVQPGVGARAVIVKSGDNLWSLAAEAVEAHLGRPPSCGEIATYWRDVVASNRVRSGDPSLIHPGETIEMPALAVN